jgi:hypothetical protein
MSTHEPMDAFTNDQLIQILVDMDDAVPRTVIDECVRRGEPMAWALLAVINDEYAEQYEELYLSPWPRLHAIMILGLSESDFSGRVLVSALKTAATEQDEFLTGWLAGFWPALLRNKPVSCIAELPKLVADPKTDLYARIAGAEVVLSFAHRQGGNALNQRLQWIASLAANEHECLEFRLLMATHLLSFPRHEHRALVDRLAGEQCIVGPVYGIQDVQSAYDEMRDTPVWDRFADPWDFYSPQAIAERMKRWSVGQPDDLEVDNDCSVGIALTNR